MSSESGQSIIPVLDVVNIVVFDDPDAAACRVTRVGVCDIEARGELLSDVVVPNMALVSVALHAAAARVVGVGVRRNVPKRVALEVVIEALNVDARNIVVSVVLAAGS